LLDGASVSNLFCAPPVAEFRPSITHCCGCGGELKVSKTRTRTASSLHVGPFHARETVLICKPCSHTYRSEELCDLVPPGANFGYDVMIYAGNALFLRYRNEEEVVAELAGKNIQISPREVSLLGMKFITYLSMAHQRRAPQITADMQSRGGYICHLDATCEGGNPLLMSSIDSLSEIVLGNVKLPAEDAEHIVPFLERIKKAYGVPLALVHDMGRGILKAIAIVFPKVPDFICHFHFLRDWLTVRKNYSQDQAAQKMIEQIDKYWEKLFADPIRVQTPDGPVLIQPQRTNNILEQFFRSLKRAHRRRTGNASSRRMLRTILAETPLVKNMENPAYMKILLNGKESLEAVFAQIDIDTFRAAFKDARNAPEKVPAKLKALAQRVDFPEMLVKMVEKTAA